LSFVRKASKINNKRKAVNTQACQQNETKNYH